MNDTNKRIKELEEELAKYKRYQKLIDCNRGRPAKVDTKKIIELYYSRKHITERQVAEIMGCSRSYVNKVIKKYREERGE